jgi:hypothetical protein
LTDSLVGATVRGVPPQHAGDPAAPSTKWEWKRVKVSPAAATDAHSRAVGPLPHAFGRTNRRVNTVLEVAYIGGRESFWWVKCRGKRYRLPGWMALEDVMSLVHHER